MRSSIVVRDKLSLPNFSADQFTASSWNFLHVDAYYFEKEIMPIKQRDLSTFGLFDRR